MNKVALLESVFDAFSGVERPSMFIRGSCVCEECMEHEQTLQQLDARNPSLTVLENPGWDPVCFASVAAYLYLLPGLVRLLLEQTDAYAQQFMFHLELQERLDALSVTQADALLRVFDYLILHQASDLDNALVVDDALRLREALNLIVRQ